MEISYDVRCTCGLSLNFSIFDNQNLIEIEPCDYCLRERYEEGYEEGKNILEKEAP